MAGDNIQLSARAYATSMTNRVKRERERIAKLVDDKADHALQQGNTFAAQTLSELAESIRSGEGAGIQVARVQPGTEDQGPAEETEVVDDNEQLPAVHHRDDFEEGAALVRNRTAFRR